MTQKFSPRVCLAILTGGVVLSWLAAFLVLGVLHMLGRWAAALLGWL